MFEFKTTTTTAMEPIEALEENLQRGKEVLLDNLLRSNLISKQVHEMYVNEYALIVKKPSFFKRLKGDKEEYHLYLVKKQN